MKERVEPESRKEKREIKLFTNKRKRKGVRGDYCIEPYSSLSTGSTRMAILHLCCIRWIAYSFFFSGAEAARVVVEDLPLAVLTFAERQLVTQCPFLPQNKQRLLSIRYYHSFAVSLPWESSLPLRSGFVVFRVFSGTAGREDFALDCPVRGRSASSDISSNISLSPLYIPPHHR